MNFCGYEISKIADVELANASDVTYGAYSAEVYESAALGCDSAELSSSSQLTDRYTYTKELTLKFSGRRIPNLASKRLIILTEDGERYLIEGEFDAAVEWTHTVSEDGDATEWRLSFESNVQVFPCDVTYPQPYAGSCGYARKIEPTLTLFPKASCIVMLSDNQIMSTERTAVKGKVTLSEGRDANGYTQSVTAEIPLTPDNAEDTEKAQEFVLYRHVASVGDGSGFYIVGLEHGMDVRVDIQTSSTESGKMTLRLYDYTTEPCPYLPSLLVTSGEDVFYNYVMYAHDGTPGFICGGDGVATAILQRGFYQDGTATEVYRARNGYSSYFPNLTLDGVFYSVHYYEGLPDCAVQSDIAVSLPPSWTFTEANGTLTGQVISESAWEARVPSGYTMSPSTGQAGTTSVTITATTMSAASAADLTIATQTGEQRVQLSKLPWSVRFYGLPEQATAEAFTAVIRVNSPYEEAVLTVSPSAAVTEKTGRNEWTVSVPANMQPIGRILSWTFSASGTTKSVTAGQYGIQESWRPSGGYICDNGDLYEEERRYVSLDGVNYSPTSEVRAGDLIEAGSAIC